MKVNIGDVVFLVQTEQYWDKPIAMKRHHVYDTKSVVLQCKVTDVRNNEFKGELFGNNSFDKDGQTFVFNVNQLLCNQNFTETSSLGKWNIDEMELNTTTVKEVQL